MKSFKRLLTLTLVLALCSNCGQNLSAQETVIDCGGSGYEQCRRAPSLAPTIALGTVALIAIVAVAVQNNNHSHSHNGSNSNSSND